MAESKLKPWADLRVKTGEYVDKDGKTKGRYATIGTLLSTPHHSNMVINIDTLPANLALWDGRVFVNIRDSWEEDTPTVTKTDTVAEVNPDEPISADNIPF